MNKVDSFLPQLTPVLTSLVLAYVGPWEVKELEGTQEYMADCYSELIRNLEIHNKRFATFRRGEKKVTFLEKLIGRTKHIKDSKKRYETIAKRANTAVMALQSHIPWEERELLLSLPPASCPNREKTNLVAARIKEERDAVLFQFFEKLPIELPIEMRQALLRRTPEAAKEIRNWMKENGPLLQNIHNWEFLGERPWGIPREITLLNQLPLEVLSACLSDAAQFGYTDTVQAILSLPRFFAPEGNIEMWQVVGGLAAAFTEAVTYHCHYCVQKILAAPMSLHIEDSTISSEMKQAIMNNDVTCLETILRSPVIHSLSIPYFKAAFDRAAMLANCPCIEAFRQSSRANDIRAEALESGLNFVSYLGNISAIKLLLQMPNSRQIPRSHLEKLIRETRGRGYSMCAEILQKFVDDLGGRTPPKS